MPVETLLKVPFVPLSEFPAHEEKLLSWMSVHVPVEKSEVGEFLPSVSRHFVEQRTLSVDDYIVCSWEDQVFGEGVPEAEGQLVVMVFPVVWVFCHVFECVVHPAHVPFHPEA